MSNLKFIRGWLLAFVLGAFLMSRTSAMIVSIIAAGVLVPWFFMWDERKYQEMLKKNSIKKE
ncbi:hypothetical protein [Enterococcus sp. DIV0800]|uniref:hypothetical protein n=1 Tax=unclassified Enterococcus TaxID=2608891 RepID=UPI003D2FC23E